MQTTTLGSAQSTSTQRGKRTRKGKQPVQDDQLGPESVFRPSWVRAMPGNCNRVIRDLFQLHLCITYPFVFLNADFCPSMPHWPFCYAGCRLPRKSVIYLFIYSLLSAIHRASAPILVNICFHFNFLVNPILT